MNPGDISGLVGRSFVSKSGNRCTLRKLADGALRINWFCRDTQADRDEANAWIVSVLRSQGIEPDIDICEDVNQEAARLAAWKRK